MRAIFFASVAFLCLSMPARATLWKFCNTLDGAQETPPNASPGSGVVTATLDDVSRQINILGSYQNLIGATDDSHLHCCAHLGEPALILFGLTNNPPHATSGTFSGSAVLDAPQTQAVLDGFSYINIHTSEVPGGEIRGQLMNPVAIVPGDFNGDGRFDAADYVMWREYPVFGSQGYAAWRANFGQAGAGSGTGAESIPEPATHLALAIAAVRMLAIRRRFR